VVIRQQRGDFTAAAIVAQPFTVYLVVLLVAHTPRGEHPDPLLRFLPLWLIPALGAITCAVWWWRARPKMRRAVKHAVIGVAVAAAICALLRVAYGARLPSWIPPEESSAPGFLLNMSAGYAEEVIFRLILLPVFLIYLRRIPVAIVLTGLAFALSHSVHLDAHFATRFLIPGCAFSVAAILVSPAFLVAAHCTAHVLIPLLF
jgi:Type II CAAX prenyl endopeptidase Rce1-like